MWQIRNLFPNQSNKNLNFVRCKLFENQSDFIRFNPNFKSNESKPAKESKLRLIWTEYSIGINPKESEMGIVRIENLFRIKSDWFLADSHQATLVKISERNSVQENESQFEICFLTNPKKIWISFDANWLEIN